VSTAYYAGNKLIACTDDEGTDHVLNREWRTYIFTRPGVPQKCVLYDTVDELIEACLIKGVKL